MVSSGGFTSGQAAARDADLLLESGPAGGVLSALNTARNNGIDRDPRVRHGRHHRQSVRRGRRRAADRAQLRMRARAALQARLGIADADPEHRSDRDRRRRRLDRARERARACSTSGPKARVPMPGPACYGRGGTGATVTDADLVLGYLNPENFLGGEMKLRTRPRASRAAEACADSSR